MNNNIKKLILVFLFVLVVFSSQFVHTEPKTNDVTAYFFFGNGCIHCTKEHTFLTQIKQKYPTLKIKSFEIYDSRENAHILNQITKELDAQFTGVPFLVIGNKYFVGYSYSTPYEIEDKIKECTSHKCPDLVKKILSQSNEPSISTDYKQGKGKTESNAPSTKIPIFGDLVTSKAALPLFTIIMGILDGFNPCAMWVLLFLIGLLLEMEDKKKMWILGTTFIIASGVVYFIFMAAWLNLLLFLGFITWIRIVIGVLALIIGGYSLKEFLFNKFNGCKIADHQNRKETFQKLKNIVRQHNLWVALVGIVMLAFIVNLIELACSAGLPATYTQVLLLNKVPAWQYYMYTLLYIIFFMIDDLFIFFIAMITFEITGITTKYTKYSKLIGGLLMLAIGLMLIFKPQWLTFG